MPFPRIPGPRPGPIGFPLEEVDPRLRLPELGGLSGLSGPVLVDIGADPIEANITRGGVQVPNLPIDRIVLTGIIDSLPVKPRLKVVRQSVEAGRAVERGTLVDLVLAEPADLPVHIVTGVLEQLRGRKISQVFDDFVAEQPPIRQILAERGQAAELSPTDKQTIVGVLGQGGITVDPDDDEAMAGAFVALQTAQLFGSG
jgi:hypothetical protein